ncbi:hypothetical protein [Sphingopyxis flava]|uniref:Secreted protein n=1 Tax=Sphingopyxis flava TaxID=1507287 RepID=A0A1T5CHM4_9SPHN|nr:hypothetical protein [Sphingopyxis flava]SKB58947.1 hypothetical protein SAMN06295937_101079 [Sphingopyxis flava]
MRRLTGLSTAAAVLVTTIGASSTPAEARGRHGGWGHRHHDRIDAGDVIGGLFVIGAIAAIASAASKQKRDRDGRYEPPYRDDPRRDADYEPRDARPYEDGAYGTGEAEARASDACSWAAEGELGDGARVESITDVRPGARGLSVTGTVSQPDGEVRSFACSYRGGRVIDVSFG